MKQHTPGPWEWDGDVWQYDEAECAPWLVQAPISDVKSQTVLSGAIRCNGEANARLIASAPDLLSALRAIVEESSDQGAVDCARAAIAKATGEQP